VYHQFDSVGMMKIIASYADDLPRADVIGKEFISPVRSLGGSYGWNLQEIRSAMKANRPLTSMKAEAARRAYEQKVNRLAWFARPDDGVNGGLTGFLYNPNVTSGSVTTGSWITNNVSADLIIADVNNVINGISTLTKGVENPNTVLISPNRYRQPPLPQRCLVRQRPPCLSPQTIRPRCRCSIWPQGCRPRRRSTTSVPSPGWTTPMV
jgi:hypothetical protein